MGLFSRIAGGLFGFSLGGPIGAIIGIVLSDVVTGVGGGAQRQISSHQQSQTIFFAATFSLLGKLAKIDGNVSTEEIKEVDRFIKEQLKLDEASAKVARQIFNEAKNSPYNYQEFASQFADIFRAQPQMLQGMLDLLLRVAAADGVFDPKEEGFIDEVARLFGTPSSLYDHLKKQYQLTSDSHYAVLNLDPDASVDEIKRSYKKMVLECHPDRVLSQGMPEDFKKVVEEKFQKIREAYEALQQQRGF